MQAEVLGQMPKRGRPKIGSRVVVRLPDRLLDDICREAIARGVPVTQVIRERCTAREFRASENPTA